MMPTRRLILLTLTAALLTACGTPPTQTASPATHPRLVVFIAIDGLPAWQVTKWQSQLAPDGFRRFLDHGASFSNAHYAHAFTVTAAGHATMLTGAYPHRTGIIANEWREQATGEPVYNTGDADAKYIGHKTDKLDGTSPRRLQVETVGDVLRTLKPQSKVIAISGKDRGAILPGGHKGVAYMYQSDSGQFASTTYYMQQHPAWVNAFHAGKPADRFFRMEWKALLPDSAYAGDVPDDQPWFGGGKGALPMAMAPANATAPDRTYYANLLRSPFADQLSLEFARAAVAGEQLGADDAPDILAVSLSGHDYVNHAYSAESRLSHDHFLQLDRMLQSFFADLDRTVGAGNYVAVLTADHGFMPAPEVSKAQGRDAGRIDSTAALRRINEGMAQKFGPGRWVVGYSGASLLLDRKLMAGKNANPEELAQEARRLLLLEPGFGTAYTRAELQSNSRAGAQFFEASRKAWHPNVSGDVQFTLKPYWMFASSTSATTHGSPHEYDTHVPLLMWGPKWVKAGRVDDPVEVIDIAPTLAQVLGVPAPSASEGRVLRVLN